jgi:peptide chain release factor subunit 1
MLCSIFSPSDCFLFSPPHPVKKFFYRCDRKFHLADLIKLYETYENYAIVLISGKHVEFYLYNTNQLKFLKSLDESLPNQHKTGGQSAVRFERIRDEKIGWYVKKIIDLMVQYYVREGKFIHKGLIIAGPAEMKEFIKEEEPFVKFFEKFLLRTITIAEITNQSIHQVIRLASDVLSSESDDKNLLGRFEQMIINPKTIDLFVFGVKEVELALNSGQLKELYVSNKYSQKEIILKTKFKTNIHIIKSNNFIMKYGEIVGIRYYAPFPEDTIENNNDIVEV